MVLTFSWVFWRLLMVRTSSLLWKRGIVVLLLGIITISSNKELCIQLHLTSNGMHLLKMMTSLDPPPLWPCHCIQYFTVGVILVYLFTSIQTNNNVETSLKRNQEKNIKRKHFELMEARRQSIARQKPTRTSIETEWGYLCYGTLGDGD